MNLIKVGLIKLGRLLNTSHIHKFNSVINYLEVGRWLKQNELHTNSFFPTRFQLYAYIAEPIKNEEVLYCEFGVFEGRSLRQWCKLIQNPKASLQGFDSFEGLPEGWNISAPQGKFNLKENIPTFDDSRVVINKGYFQETLPLFQPPRHDRLVLNLDADLYSSTKYVLTMMRPYIRNGTLLIFDEFSDRLNELKAFDEFLNETNFSFRLVASTKTMGTVAFECLSDSI
jgi:O-methyltransferase